MPTLEKINFKQSLDFTETFNVAVKFIRQNFFHLIKCILLIAGPFILFSAIANGLYQKSVFSMQYIRTREISSIIGQVIVLVVTVILSSLAVIGTTYEYILLYMEKGPKNFDVNDVGRALVKDIGNILWTFFGILLLSFAAGFVIGLVFFLFAKVSGIFAGLFAVLLILGMLIILPPLFFVLSSTYIVRLKDRTPLMESISHSFRMMKENFWWTWLIMVCMYFAVALIQMIFLIPQAIMSAMMTVTIARGGESEASVTFLVISALGSFCSTMMYFIYYVFIATHYFSLREKKEGTGLLERIGEIGTRKDDSVEGTY